MWFFERKEYDDFKYSINFCYLFKRVLIVWFEREIELQSQVIIFFFKYFLSMENICNDIFYKKNDGIRLVFNKILYMYYIMRLIYNFYE